MFISKYLKIYWACLLFLSIVGFQEYANADAYYSSNPVSVASGDYHTCGLWQSTESGNPMTVECWGRNDYGQAGAVSNAQALNLPVQTFPEQIAGLSTNIKQLVAGADFNCVLLTTGAIQ